MDQMPTFRDGAVFALINQQIGGGQSEDSKTISSSELEKRPKRKKVLVLMGGDRFQRAFNDTFLIDMK